MIQTVKSYSQFDGLSKTPIISEYLNAFHSLGESFPELDNLYVRDLKYMGTFDVYLIDMELKYKKKMVCSLFESDKSDYRAVVTYDFDHTYHIVFDESRNTIVNYLYQKNRDSLLPMAFTENYRFEEEIYAALLTMIISDENRLQITYNTDRLLLLRQVKELR
jgi:hypothetical protein